MKTNQLIKWLAAVCAVVLIAAVGWSFRGVFSQIGSYAHAEKYTAGETVMTDEVENLEINWTSGRVNVQYHTGNTVELRETANRSLNEDEKMHWWLDGNTLRVQYAGSGLRIGRSPEKELTVLLPENLKLKDAVIDLTSGTVNLPDLKAEHLKISATSGDILAETESGTVDVSATSGRIDLKLAGNTEKVKLGSTSGEIHLTAERVSAAEIGCTSGTVTVTCKENETMKIGSTSGRVTVALGKLGTLDIGTTSGDVTAKLPAEPGFTAVLESLSGGVKTEIAATCSGNTYTCGDGSGKVSVSATSGSILLLPAE